MDLEQTISQLWPAFESMVYLLNPQKRLYWGYLLSSLGLACLLVWFKSSSHKVIFKSVFSAKLWLHPSSLLDFRWLAVNHLLRTLIVVPLLGGQIGFALLVNSYCYQWFGEGNFLKWSALEVSALFTLTLFFLEDFTRFLIHFAYHRVPFLWRFHAIHHSAEVLTPVTLYRIHWAEMLLNSCRSLMIIGTTSGIFIYCFSASVSAIDIVGVNIFNFLFNVMGSNLRHSPVWIGFGAVEKWFISPAQHQIHHSVDPKHYDKNFGASLAVWDRMLGSLLLSKNQNVPGFGLATHEVISHQLKYQILGIKS